MGVYIKNTDMPKGCDETCPLKSAGWCCEDNDCPLIEIDDKLFKEAESAYVLQQIRSR